MREGRATVIALPLIDRKASACLDQEHENRLVRSPLELLLQLMPSCLDAMRLQACVVRPRMWILVWGNPAQQRLENRKESEVA